MLSSRHVTKPRRISWYKTKRISRQEKNYLRTLKTWIENHNHAMWTDRQTLLVLAQSKQEFLKIKLEFQNAIWVHANNYLLLDVEALP